ncbi:MBG domain-containing protein, partial [Labilibaculum sp. K2S]|uniref:MBG domain-containing protein n=1 Tax=Labilibaculum sp. K2S TaxID=3056386 RepID=UPI0025A3DAA1
EAVGSYAISQGTLSAGSNYDLTFVSKDFSITKKSLAIAAENKSKEYDGTVYIGFTVTYSGFISGEDESDLSGTLAYSGTATTATNVGTGYAITPGGLTSSNYAITFAAGSLDITQKSITVTADAGQTKVYGDADPTYTYTASASLETGDSFSGALSRATGEDVGSYAIGQGTLSAGSNYDLTFVSKDFSITQKAITVTADAGQTKVYGDADPTYTYTASASLETGDSFSGALSRATGENVGSYAIGQGTLSAGSNYDLTFVSKDFSITQKSITVTADADQTKVYGDADPTFTYTTSSTLETGDSFSGALSRATGENVGSYAIGQGTLSAGSNYTLTFVSKD